MPELIKPIIVCDMDGTLAKSRQPASEEMIRSIEILSRRYHFVIITGGKLSLIQDQITNLFSSQDIRLYLFPTSGNQFWIFSDGQYENIYQNRISTDDQNLVLNSIIGCISRFKLMSFTDDQIELRDSQITFSILGRSAPYELKNQYDPKGEKRRVFVEFMKRNHPRLATDFEVRIGGTTSIDFTYKGMDKGFGLNKIKEHFRINNREIIFFGDKCFEDGNDWEIARKVPYVPVENEDETLDKFKRLINQEVIEILDSHIDLE